MSNDNSDSEVQTSQSEPKPGQRIFTYKASKLIWLALYVVEILIALRIVLKFMPANPASPIVSLYQWAHVLASCPICRINCPNNNWRKGAGNVFHLCNGSVCTGCSGN